jgi:hypothetical protein
MKDKIKEINCNTCTHKPVCLIKHNLRVSENLTADLLQDTMHDFTKVILVHCKFHSDNFTEVK